MEGKWPSGVHELSGNGAAMVARELGEGTAAMALLGYGENERKARQRSEHEWE